jgi:hypothetical protein
LNFCFQPPASWYALLPEVFFACFFFFRNFFWRRVFELRSRKARSKNFLHLSLELTDHFGMSFTQEPTFTGQQAADAQTALRKALGLAPEQFPVAAFVGMVSDEIEQLRSRGETDEAIAELIAQATGVSLSADAIGRYYASPQARGHHHQE